MYNNTIYNVLMSVCPKDVKNHAVGNDLQINLILHITF